MTTVEEPIATEAAQEDVRIIDCDAHFTEPADLWTSRVPDAWKDRVPQQREVNGRTSWWLNGEVWASIGGNTIRQGREKILGEHVVQPFSEVDPSAWDVKERLALMDEMGIEAQVIYPNGIGFASNHIFAIEDPEQRRMVLQTYNDFYVDIQEESGKRLLPQAVLPTWDIGETVAEIERLLDKGITGFTLSDKPELIGLPELPDPYFDPMWDLFNESGAVPNFHIGSGARKEELEAIRARRFLSPQERAVQDAKPKATVDPAWSYFGNQRQLAVGATQMFISNLRIIANLTMSDLFDRFPKLKIVSAESGIGWVPFILEALEFQLDEMVTDPVEKALVKRRPTEYFRDHLYVMFWFEEHAPQTMIEKIGINNVLVETDVPHPTCLYPGAKEHFAKVLGGLDAHTRRRVLRDNAAELYRID